MSSDLEMEIVCRAPNKVESDCAALFKRFVLATGEVSSHTFPYLYEQALVVCFAKAGEGMAGVGAIKRPSDVHRDGVFKKAKATVSSKPFVYELGWFHVLRRYKGQHISSRMVEALMPWADGASIYATSRVNNNAMHAALIKHGGFVPEGVDYPSNRRRVSIRLFTRLVVQGASPAKIEHGAPL